MDSTPITFAVVAPDSSEVFFKANPKALFRKIHDSYCERQAVHPSFILFKHNGLSLDYRKTLQEQNIQSGDRIEAFLINPEMTLIVEKDGERESFKVNKCLLISDFVNFYKSKHELADDATLVHEYLEFDEGDLIENVFEDEDVLFVLQTSSASVQST